MSEYIILEKTHLVGLADMVRENQGTTDEMTFDELIAGLNSGLEGGGIALDSELTRQEELIAELSSVLDSKAVPDIFSVISVTYPIGSTCLCVDSNGSAVGIASDSDDGEYGYALFSVDEIGTYTVSCTDGTETASKDVEIFVEGQAVSVELSYIFYIVGGGADVLETTGGFTGEWISSQWSIDSTTGNLQLSRAAESGSQGQVGHTVKTYDLTNVNSVMVNVSEFSRSGTTYDTEVGIAKGNAYSDIVAKVEINAKGEYAIDVSGYTGEYAIAFALSYSGVNLTIDEMRFD